MKCFIVSLIGILLYYSSNAQLQLRLNIKDVSSQLAVSNASVTIKGDKTEHYICDSTGNLTVMVMPGRYSIIAEHKNFKSKVFNDVIILSGKQYVLDIELDEFKKSLDTITVNTLQIENSLDSWNTQRIAASFYDPARVASSYAGVVNADDQANTVIVRGTSPVFLQWKTEGVEIVNPNHLENAGTINDRPALNSGGVCMLSAQLMQNSTFMFAPFESNHGNALSGIFDIKFRKGNDEKREHAIQAGLLGIDLCTEGYFSKKSKASYIINFRYSTVGLLSLMGVNFGDEAINYNDLSYVFNFPLRRGAVKIFGAYGGSKNVFTGKSDTSLVEVEKDLKNINYSSVTTINGISIVNSLSNSSYFKFVVAYSDKDIHRASLISAPQYSWLPVEKDRYFQSKLSSLLQITQRLGGNTRFKAGAYANYFNYWLKSSLNDKVYLDGVLNEPLIQPFVGVEQKLFTCLEIHAGLHSFFQPRINYFDLQPRLNARINLGEYQSIFAEYGKSSQLLPASVVLGNSGNMKLQPITSNAFSLSHGIQIKRFHFKSELYYRLFNQIPVNDSLAFSAFNYFNESVSFPLENKGKAKVYGIDFTLEKRVGAFYLIASAGLFKSVYEIQGIYYSARFNVAQNYVLTSGKEFKCKNPNKFFSINFRANYRNGLREADDQQAQNHYAYPNQISPYSRFDVRLSFRKNKTQSSHIWALDIQNVTNRQNVSYHYYDNFTNQTEARYQLGLIPVLSYKILF